MGLNLNAIFGAVITLSVTVMVLGIALTILGKLATTSGITANAASAVNSSVLALDDFIEWIGIIVIAIAGGVVFTLVLKAFQGGTN